MRRLALVLRSLAVSCVAGLALAAGLASFAHSAPRSFPMPDGSTLVRDELNVAPYLAAWKARAFAREHAAARASTPNQLAYDANWYDLNLTFTPSTSMVSGTVRMKATVVAGPISTVDLDFYSNMTVDGVTSAGAATTYSRAANVLTLNLGRAYATGEVVDVTVTYHGTPSVVAGYFGFTTYYSRQLIWSLSEAYGSRTWWPCKDAPEDKADSVDVHFTCPSALTTISNGTLRSTVNNGSTVTANWHERYPIATYLVFIASYPYTVVNDWYRPSPTDSLPLRFNIAPENVATAATVDAKVKTMIAAYASRMGEYPFMGEKYGQAEFTFGGGMEHQTNTCIGGSAYIESIVAHELMHQWWGDMITCNDFHHVWLNEGFATYGEALWQEYLGGLSAYQTDMNANAYYGSGTIYVPDATDETRVFDSNLSYSKGSWVMHMLRHVLGDSTFFLSLRTYREQWGYRSATTENFRDVCEAVSGRNLHDYFQQWIYGEYYPQYRTGWSASNTGAGYDVTVTLDQTQSWQLFHMPVDVTVTTASSSTTFVVDDSLASQTFVLHVDAAPTMVQIDKDGWILKSLETVVANPTFEKAVLLVNGVDWATYGTEITSAYTDRAFWGTYTIEFWDNFAAPSGGYPATLPTPLGHGAVPADLLGHYRVVVWVGNNYNGDLPMWQSTPILSYLRAGGDVLLMTRQGDQFLGDSLRTYLGINWTNTSTTLNDCIATRPGYVNQSLLSTQSLCSVFDTVRTTSESQLLFKVSSGFTPNRGIGALRIPAGGMGRRPIGGRLAFLSGRPYRWNHAQLQANVSNLLANGFLEPANGVAVGPDAPVTRVSLEAARPNPSSVSASLRFALARAGHARLQLVDVSGRRVRTLVDGAVGAGPHEAVWDGRAEDGGLAPAGLYWARLEADGAVCTRRVVRLR
jgi:hypothetical protein